MIGYTHSYAVSGSTPYSGFVSWQTRDSSLIYDQSPAKPVSCFFSENEGVEESGSPAGPGVYVAYCSMPLPAASTGLHRVVTADVG